MFERNESGIIYKTPSSIVDRPCNTTRYTASGYGAKIPTSKMCSFEGSNRMYRIYCMIYSNSGTCYVIMGKKRYVVNV